MSFFFAGLLTIYVIFVIYFSIVKTSTWVLLNKANDLEQKKKQIKQVHHQIFVRQHSIKGATDSEALSKKLKKFRSKNKQLIRKASTINEDQFNVFEPLVDELRKDSRLAMFGHLIITVRRLTLLYMAMFVLGQQWLQILSFMLLNVVSLCYLLLSMPYENQATNYMNIINEVISLMITYFIA